MSEVKIDRHTLPEDHRMFFCKNYLPIDFELSKCFWKEDSGINNLEKDSLAELISRQIKWPNENGRVIPNYQQINLIKYIMANGHTDPNIFFEKEKSVIYHLNNDGHRSDNVSNFLNTKNILFSGCSVTFGVGVDLTKTWAYRTYKELNVNREYGNYYNISLPGSSFIEIVSNLFRYFKKYGNPNILFVLIPNLSRDIRYTNEVFDKPYDNSSYDNSSSFAKLDFYFYLMLDQYCKTNNIKLITTSWFHNRLDDNYVKNAMEDFEKSFFNFFDTYKWINPKEYYDDIKYYISNNLNEKDLTIAEDNAHPGTAMHYALYRFMIREYYKTL